MIFITFYCILFYFSMQQGINEDDEEDGASDEDDALQHFRPIATPKYWDVKKLFS
jgi:hypothetical protein